MEGDRPQLPSNGASVCTFSERDFSSPFPEVPVNQRNGCAATNRVRRLLRLTGVSDSFGAGTIIDCPNGSPTSRSGRSCRSPGRRETRRHRPSPSPLHRRVTPPTAPQGDSNHPPPCASIPPDCAWLRFGLISGASRSLTAPRRRHGSIVTVVTRASLGAGGDKVVFDVSYCVFPACSEIVYA